MIVGFSPILVIKPGILSYVSARAWIVADECQQIVLPKPDTQPSTWLHYDRPDQVKVHDRLRIRSFMIPID